MARTIDDFMAELEDIGTAIALSKRRAMRYQADAKDRVAADIGTTGERLDLPYAQWCAVYAAWAEGDFDKARRLAEAYP